MKTIDKSLVYRAFVAIAITLAVLLLAGVAKNAMAAGNFTGKIHDPAAYAGGAGLVDAAGADAASKQTRPADA